MNDTMLTILVLLIVAFAVMFWLRRKSPKAAVVEQPKLAAVEQPNPAPANQPIVDQPVDEPGVDQQILDQLREAGSDLTKPHQMEFLLYFPTEETAQKVANKIRPDGFRVDVKRSAQGSAWLCVAMKRMVPKRAEIAAIGKRFSALAKDSGGEYDGWETSVEK